MMWAAAAATRGVASWRRWEMTTWATTGATTTTIERAGRGTSARRGERRRRWRRGQAAAAAEQAARADGGCPPPTCGEGPVGMSGCGGPAVTPVCCRRCFLRLDDAFTLPVTTWAFNDGQLPGHKNSRSLRRHERGAPLTRTPPRRSWGRGPSPPGWRRIQARRSTCLLLRAVQRRRVESLVLGALSSSPVHRALVLVLGTNIAVSR